jgi:hypothetical protein
MINTRKEIKKLKELSVSNCAGKNFSKCFISATQGAE